MHRVPAIDLHFSVPKLAQCSLLAACLLLNACGREEAPMTEGASELTAKHLTQKAETVPVEAENSKDPSVQETSIRNFVNEAKAVYTQAKNNAALLTQHARQFVDNPTSEHLTNLRIHWQRTHDAYATTSLFRQLALKHPVLDQQQLSGDVIHPVNIRLDKHPIIPGYLDEVEGYPLSGLIHSDIALDFATLNREHQFSDPGYVTLGFHALEFMLWGEAHLPEHMQRARYAPQDLQEKTGETIDPGIVKRRKQYVVLLADTIESDITLLHSAWTSETAWYPAQLRKLSGPQYQQLIRQAIERESKLLTSDYNKDSLHSYRSGNSAQAREALYLRLAKEFPSNNKAGNSKPGK